MPESWELRYRTAYTELLGQRLRRVREGRHLTQSQALHRARRPSGAAYSRGLLSRIENGYANSPLYVYLQLAEAYDLDPARMMGREEAEKPVGEAEMTLLKFLRRVGVAPDEVMALIARI